MNLYKLHKDPSKLIDYGIQDIWIFSNVVEAIDDIKELIDDPEFDDPDSIMNNFDWALAEYNNRIELTPEQKVLTQTLLENKIIEFGDPYIIMLYIEEYKVGRWSKAEPVLKRRPQYWQEYKTWLSRQLF